MAWDSVTIDFFLAGMAMARVRFPGRRVKPERVRRGEGDFLTWSFLLVNVGSAFTSIWESLSTALNSLLCLCVPFAALASAVGAAAVAEAACELVGFEWSVEILSIASITSKSFFVLGWYGGFKMRLSTDFRGVVELIEFNQSILVCCFANQKAYFELINCS